MNKIVLTVLTSCLAIGLSASVLAAEKAKNGFRIWSNSSGDQGPPNSDNLLSMDWDPAVAGLEIVGGTEKTTHTAPDTAHKVMTVYTQRFVIKNVDATADFFVPATLPLVRSLAYPNPMDAQFQCGGLHETSYEIDHDWLGCPSPGHINCPGSCWDPSQESDRFPQSNAFGIGMANSGTSTRALVFGNQLAGRYHNDIDGDVDIGTFGVTVYSTAGVMLWTKTFKSDDAGFRLEPLLSGVAGHHLASFDQLRVGAILKGDINQTFRYQFYSILNGKLASTSSVVIDNP